MMIVQIYILSNQFPRFIGFKETTTINDHDLNNKVRSYIPIFFVNNLFQFEIIHEDNVS
jgi:hypothetical protein